jgi:hypothetical protein
LTSSQNYGVRVTNAMERPLCRQERAVEN